MMVILHAFSTNVNVDQAEAKSADPVIERTSTRNMLVCTGAVWGAIRGFAKLVTISIIRIAGLANNFRLSSTVQTDNPCSS